MTVPRGGVERAFLGFGSNLGDRLVNLQRAADALSRHEALVFVRSSRIYETEPVGPPQPDYLNAVVELVTRTTPIDLLHACLGVENELGRVRGERWGPRVVDLDLLTFGRRTIDQPRLQIPHPRMHERAFVLAPLLELDRDPVLPGGRSLANVRLSRTSWPGLRLYAPPLVVPGGSRGLWGGQETQSTGKVPPARQYSPPSRSRKPSSTR